MSSVEVLEGWMFCLKKRRVRGLTVTVEIFKGCHVEDKLNLFYRHQRTN